MKCEKLLRIGFVVLLMISVILGATASDGGNLTDGAGNDESETVDFKNSYVFWGAVIIFIAVFSILALGIMIAVFK